MAFCQNCGAQVEGKFCARCGASVNPATPDGSAAPPPPPPPPGTQAYGTQSPYGTQPPYTAPLTTTGLTDNLAGALCYALGLITGVIFLVLAPYNQNKFIRFHAFQSIFFHVAWIALWIVQGTLTLMMPWSLHLILTLLSLLLSFGGLVIWIVLLIKAYQNERFKLPIIGDLAEKQA